LKTARERMDVIAAYRELGSFRAAAAVTGTTHKTVKRIVESHEQGAPEHRSRGHNYEDVAEIVRARIARTNGRITAKRLLPEVVAAGYSGSARNFRRLVAEEKNRYRQGNHRGRRPGVWAPGEVLAIDWGVEAGLHVFCAVSAWSRFRFVRFADNERRDTTLGFLAECFEILGGVPKVVLADRMGCLKAGVVANLVIPVPDYVRFATHYGFRPDFCEAADPESKGLVEHLVGYAKSDLIVPGELSRHDLVNANDEAKAWCSEVNGTVHSEIFAVPTERLAKERELFGSLPSLRVSLVPVVTRKVDKLSCIRFGSARYSVPVRHIGRAVQVRVEGARVDILDLGEIVATHDLVAPGEVSVNDEHYGGPRPAPRRAPRPRTEAERAFLSLGEVATSFLKGAAATASTRLPAELEELCRLEAAFGREALIEALKRAVHFGRFRAADVQAILEAGSGVQRPSHPGEALIVPIGEVRARSLAEYAPEAFS
jgi:transposase